MKEMELLQQLNFIRTAGSNEELKAANIICAQLQELGLNPYLDSFKIDGRKYNEVSLEVVKPYQKKIVCKGYGNCENVTDLTGELYYYQGNVDYSCHDVKDKIVLFDSSVSYWNYKDLIDNNAKGFIACNGNLIDDKDDIDERYLRKPLRELGLLPAVAINVSSAFEMLKQGATEVKMTTNQETFEVDSHNVVCKIAGEIDETIVFTAHYDSTALSKGVYDNATGSVGILKIAEYFAKNKPYRSLIFVFCGSEEVGLLGSKDFVKKYQDDLAKVVLNINLDMIGTVLGNFLACCTSETSLVSYIDSLSKEEGFTIDSHQGVYSSDSTPFADAGIPAVSFARITKYSPIHCKYDQIEMMSQKQMENDIEFILKFALRMVNAKVVPVKKIMPENMKNELDYYLLRKKRP